MGAPAGEGGELERRNSQEGANYRRPIEQPPSHQQAHHAQPSNPGNEQEEKEIAGNPINVFT